MLLMLSRNLLLLKTKKRKKRKRKVHRQGEVCAFKLQILDQALLRLVEGSVCGSRRWSELRDPQDSAKTLSCRYHRPCCDYLIACLCFWLWNGCLLHQKLVRRRSIDGNVVTNPTLCLLPKGREVDFSDHSVCVRLVTVKPSWGISCLGFTSFENVPHLMRRLWSRNLPKSPLA